MSRSRILKQTKNSLQGSEIRQVKLGWLAVEHQGEWSDEQLAGIK